MIGQPRSLPRDFWKGTEVKGKNKPSGQAWCSNEASGTEERQLNRVQHLPLGFDSASAPMLSCLKKGRDGGRIVFRTRKKAKIKT